MLSQLLCLNYDCKMRLVKAHRAIRFKSSPYSQALS